MEYQYREFIEESIKSGFESGQGQEGLDGRDHVVQCSRSSYGHFLLDTLGAPDTPF